MLKGLSMVEDVQMPGEEARGILWGDLPEFSITEDAIVGKRRWSIDHRLIVQRVSDGAFFESYYSVGATEIQVKRAWEDEDATFSHVVPVQKVVTVYERPGSRRMGSKVTSVPYPA